MKKEQKNQRFFSNDFFKKNRKGFLLAEETLKMIIAVIAIGFLAYFLTALYFNSVNSQKLRQAQNSIDRISDVINNLQVEIENVDITPPGWHLFSFVSREKPNSCSGENCLCICNNVFLGFGSQTEKCTEKGVCEIVENLQGFEDIEIKTPLTTVEVIKSENEIIIREK